MSRYWFPILTIAACLTFIGVRVAQGVGAHPELFAPSGAAQIFTPAKEARR